MRILCKSKSLCSANLLISDGFIRSLSASFSLFQSLGIPTQLRYESTKSTHLKNASQRKLATWTWPATLGLESTHYASTIEDRSTHTSCLVALAHSTVGFSFFVAICKSYIIICIPEIHPSAGNTIHEERLRVKMHTLMCALPRDRMDHVNMCGSRFLRKYKQNRNRTHPVCEARHLV